MSAASTLDPDAGPARSTARPPGHDTGSLGPSDSSDTGSDSVGPGGYDDAILGEDGDSVGTGVDPSPAERNSGDTGTDIGFDRIVGAGEAGLGGGLDQAEEARYGVTDEEMDPVDEAGAALDPDGGEPVVRSAADDDEADDEDDAAVGAAGDGDRDVDLVVGDDDADEDDEDDDGDTASS